MSPGFARRATTRTATPHPVRLAVGQKRTAAERRSLDTGEKLSDRTIPQAPSSYPPPAQFAEQANAGEELYREAEQDRLAFWAKQANRLSWATPFTEVLDWSEAPFAKWFADGKLNVAYNCVDRHVEAGHGDRVAIHWEGEPSATAAA